MCDNCPNLLGQVDGIRSQGCEQGRHSAWHTSARRKCHTQRGAGPQVSVRRSTEAEELGAGRLQQTVTFEADPEEFPPSAGPLVPSCGGLSAVLVEQPVSPWVVLSLGLMTGEGLLSRSRAQPLSP